MAIAASRKAENLVALRGDKIVRRLEDFPELMQALRRGDLLTGRLICAQIFMHPTLVGMRAIAETATDAILPFRPYAQLPA